MSEQKLTPFCSGDFVKLAVNDHIRVENYVTNEHSHSGGPSHGQIMKTIDLIGERIIPYCN